jgi:hypothetical protein
MNTNRLDRDTRDTALPLPELKTWLNWVITLGGKKAPLVTALMVGALVVFSVGLAVLYLGRGIDLWKILLMAAAGIVIGLIALLVAKVAARRSVGALGDVVAWLLAGVFIAVIGLVISVVFFGEPRAGMIFIAKVIQAPTLASSSPQTDRSITSSTALTGLDPIFRHPPDGVDEVERVSDLAKYPALRVQNTTLLARPGESLYLAANTLDLTDSTIVTNGASVTIEVLHLSSVNSHIRAFDQSQAGHEGDGDGDGGTVTIIVHDKTAGSRLAVDLTGKEGAAGQAGLPGSVGAQGSPGANAASGLLDCQRGAASGGDGQRGGAGGDGTVGSPGGSGGTLIIAGRISPSNIDFRSDGGAGGRGGAGAHGGGGGPGGPGGGARGLCQGGGSTGAQGPEGASGHNGSNGANGKPGRLIVKNLSDVL